MASICEEPKGGNARACYLTETTWGSGVVMKTSLPSDLRGAGPALLLGPVALALSYIRSPWALARGVSAPPPLGKRALGASLAQTWRPLPPLGSPVSSCHLPAPIQGQGQGQPWGERASRCGWCTHRCLPCPTPRASPCLFLPDSSDVERLERFFDSEDEDFEILSL